ncbi:MAG: hypothetical protein DRN30_01130 [Thermoplasmata archaeon]|nr:MAG: hypothetical protein DRN30_01130 [Thermoplasmata archaeon]
MAWCGLSKDLADIILDEGKKIRTKAFRQLIELAVLYKNLEIVEVEGIVEKLGCSLRTAYDYYNCLKLLEIIFKS